VIGFNRLNKSINSPGGVRVDLQLKDKPIFIAGASRGIGLGIAETCLQEGAKVAITSRDVEELEETRKRLAATYGANRIWAAPGDMCDTATIESCVMGAETALGPLYGAVANVGGSPPVPGFDLTDEHWEAGLTQNLGSAFKLARTVLRGMTARGEGALVFISSIAGMEAFGSPMDYSASKAAINHLARELSKNVGPLNVRVNTVAPGRITFPGGYWDQRLKGKRAEYWKEAIASETPLRRLGTPEDIGAAVSFLLSPAAGFITGSIVVVDGGQSR
jgi:3-oxoacyl-[acyl-carrier protein] reductase